MAGLRFQPADRTPGPMRRQRGDRIQDILLQIWRKGNFKNYKKVKDIELPSMCDSPDGGRLNILERCGMMRPNCVNIYGCTLKGNFKVKVEAEDILGITLPPKNRTRFELYFKNSMVSNYIFEHSPLSITINLSNHTNQTAVQPLIIVDIKEPGNLL